MIDKIVNCSIEPANGSIFIDISKPSRYIVNYMNESKFLHVEYLNGKLYMFNESAVYTEKMDSEKAKNVITRITSYLFNAKDFEDIDKIKGLINEVNSTDTVYIGNVGYIVNWSANDVKNMIKLSNQNINAYMMLPK